MDFWAILTFGKSFFRTLVRAGVSVGMYGRDRKTAASGGLVVFEFGVVADCVPCCTWVLLKTAAVLLFGGSAEFCTWLTNLLISAAG